MGSNCYVKVGNSYFYVVIVELWDLVHQVAMKDTRYVKFLHLSLHQNHNFVLSRIMLAYIQLNAQTVKKFCTLEDVDLEV